MRFGKLDEMKKDNSQQRYTRAPKFDRRFSRGDDFAGDGWIDTQTNRILWCVVGRDPNSEYGVCLGEIPIL